MKRIVGRLLDAADERRRIEERTSPATKIALRSLFLRYRGLWGAGSTQIGRAHV